MRHRSVLEPAMQYFLALQEMAEDASLHPSRCALVKAAAGSVRFLDAGGDSSGVGISSGTGSAGAAAPQPGSSSDLPQQQQQQDEADAASAAAVAASPRRVVHLCCCCRVQGLRFAC
jgi:hypothetical protein